MDLSVSAVFGAGVLTFLSPCVLPLIPVYLAVLGGGAVTGGEGHIAPKRTWLSTVLATLVFVVGFSIVFSIMGLSATAIGRALAAHKATFQRVSGVVVVVLGLSFMGYVNLPFLQGGGALSRLKVTTRFQYLNALILGVIFAFAWTPCVGAVLGTVLTYTALTTTSPVKGMGFLLVYSLGFGTPLVLLALFAGKGMSLLTKARRYLGVFEKVSGLVLVLFGFMLVTDTVALVEPSPGSALHFDSPVPSHLLTARPKEGATCSEDSAKGTCKVSRMPRLLWFHSPTCTVCAKMLPVVTTLRNDCVDKGLSFEAVDVSTEEGRRLAERYRVTGIPVSVFLDDNGREVARLVGYQDIAPLRQAAAIVVGEQCKGYRPLRTTTPSPSNESP